MIKHDKAAAIKLPKCADNVFSLRINDSVFVVRDAMARKSVNEQAV